MRILLLDDRGSVNVSVAGLLEDEGYVVMRAFNCNDADSYWRQADCLIVDLNLPASSSDGLTSAEIKRTCGGVLTGWVWLKNHVLRERPQMAERTIVYSEYLPNLRQEVSPIEIGDVTLISKASASSSIEQVLRRVKAISAMPALRES